MTQTYVQFQDEARDKVVAIFPGTMEDDPQPLDAYPVQGMLDGSDELVLNYLNPPITPEMELANNTATRNSLLSIATLAINPLQDAVDLDDATDADIALLKKWKQYRVAVNRADLNLPNVIWPVPPV
ncbi:tail fiber assembly protein [Pseudomonas fluorescens]|jgi:hypothetical protein|uniref:Tail fiber assembly protein n=1 Tax=Pseudomonas fluorescens TaxID=294 RepID=A0A5E7JDM7_PSEFL|nr:tail fiber assembly protein [Pseudomonas fluorescens]VVO86795.1 hypothetical protein PS854_02087 [Pseudomonas fluorescens]